jgi:predicted transcriptional regulator
MSEEKDSGLDEIFSIGKRVENALETVNGTLRNLDKLKTEMEEIRRSVQTAYQQKKKSKRQIILEVMEENGISEDEMAQLIGVTLKAFKNYIEGKIDLESKFTIRISQLLNILHDLLK